MTARTRTRTRTRTGARTAPRPGAQAPRPPRGQEHTGFPPATFDIPDQWWSDTATPQTEVTRARRRAAIKRYARTVWHEAVTHGRAWKVDRYVACIAVAYPHERDTFPAQAAETVKPIIDAGTEYGLWPDDDSTHRCATIYFRAPGRAPAHRHRLTVFIIPVPTRPAYVVSRDLNQTIIDAARDRGQEYHAASLQFTVPFGLWVTSNITDSDILARQHGHRKASTWGGRRAQGVRERTIGTLRSMGADKWRRTGMSLTGTPFITFAGIRYATDRDADPDNAAETVDALMRAGADAGCIDGVSGTQCKATVFFRLKGKAEPSEHDVKLYAVAIPDGTQWLDLLLDSCDRAWRRGGAR